jgi:penicillin G amidase
VSFRVNRSTGPGPYSVGGLRSRAEILVDSWGVPHIYAASTYDAFFVQGFNAARDRLWQIDLWRRRGLGLLSEVFGPSYVERDRAARLFLYRGGMHLEWLCYGSDTKRIVTAFVNGINEYVKLVERRPELLPEEFEIMGYGPALWSPEDVVRIRSHGLTQNVRNEVYRALVLRDFGPGVEAIRSGLEPPWKVTVPEGLNLDLIPVDVLEVYELATSGVEFAEDTPKTTPATAKEAALARRQQRGQEGSNNWAISPDRTATGRPILANDPHRDQSVPSLRYVAHLVAPGLNVIGAGEPALPGVSIGHNERVAFGMTVFSIDQEDLYIYETNPENPSEYRYKGRWEPMETEQQSIPVNGGNPAEVELKYTRHGPVIREDPEKRTAFAVRAAWLEPGMAPYLGSIEYMRAGNWNEFLAAMNRWGAPGENQVYADTEGNIGWKPAGLTPIRPNWDGLLPVPGDGRYEWENFLDMDELPVEFNPSRGWIATANEMNLPEGYPYRERKIGFEWYAPFRYQRIAEVLETARDHTLRNSADLQTDYLSMPARAIVARLRGLRSEEQKVEVALEMLRGWDCILAADSAPATLFEVWYRLHLRPTLQARAVAEAAPTGDLIEAVAAATPLDEEIGEVRADPRLLENPDGRLGPNSEKVLTEVMLSTLKDAIQHIERLLGPDREGWEWGKLHHALLVHPLSPLVDEEIRERLDVGPLPRGGSGDTVGSTPYRLEDFRQIGGASWRVVVDVGAWDNSLAMNSPGQSGDPQSHHYSDLFVRWAEDDAFPLLFTDEAISAATPHRIVLEPAGAGKT